jgi:hypothetical protein
VEDADEGTDEVVGVGFGMEITAGDGALDREYEVLTIFVDSVLLGWMGGPVSFRGVVLFADSANRSGLLPLWSLQVGQAPAIRKWRIAVCWRVYGY